MHRRPCCRLAAASFDGHAPRGRRPSGCSRSRRATRSLRRPLNRPPRPRPQPSPSTSPREATTAGRDDWPRPTPTMPMVRSPPSTGPGWPFAALRNQARSHTPCGSRSTRAHSTSTSRCGSRPTTRAHPRRRTPGTGNSARSGRWSTRRPPARSQSSAVADGSRGGRKGKSPATKPGWWSCRRPATAAGFSRSCG